MFKIYYVSAIDVCVDKAFKQIEEFKKLFNHYTTSLYSNDIEGYGVKSPIEVYGAGFGDSPIITPETSSLYKGAISAYDLRKIRECDIVLFVTDLKTFCPGSCMELEYARNLGIYSIVYVLPTEQDCGYCDYIGDDCIKGKSLHCFNIDKVKNIFLETYANKIIYSKEELIEILEDLTQ